MQRRTRQLAGRISPDGNLHWSQRTVRTGIGLFEIVLALAIFFGASLAMSQILRTGSRASVSAHLTSKAELIAESQMNKVLAGIEPLTAVSKKQVSEHQGWVWSLAVTQTDVPFLMKLELTSELEELAFGMPMKFTLVRFQRDPTIFSLNETAAQ